MWGGGVIVRVLDTDGVLPVSYRLVWPGESDLTDHLEISDAYRVSIPNDLIDG